MTTSHLRRNSRKSKKLDLGRPPAGGAPLTMELELGAWIDALDHPSHRRGKASAGRWNFAQTASGAVWESLRQVVGAEWQDDLYRIDGHARAGAWASGMIPQPDNVRATIFFPRSEKEFFDLYQAYHATNTVLSRLDEIQGAFREHGLDLKSRRLKHGLLVQSFALALRGEIKNPTGVEPVDLRRAVDVFSAELKCLDRMNPVPEVFQTGVVSAALIGLAIYPKGAAFFERLSEEKGNKRDGLMDPVECVLSLVERIRYEGTASIDAVQEDLCARTFRAYLAFMRGDRKSFESRVNNTMKRYWFKRSIQAVDLEPYIVRLRRKKKIANETNL